MTEFGLRLASRADILLPIEPVSTPMADTQAPIAFMSSAETSGSGAPVDRSVRLFILAATWLVGSTALSLLLFPEATDRYFSWTIQPPLTAAWLGAGYASAFLALWLTRTRGDWADIRIGVAVVATGLVAILAATLLHLDRFHWSSPHATARLWAWAWLAWYAVLPPALGFTLWRQRRVARTVAPGPSPVAQATPLPGAFRGLALLTAAAMTVYGAGLFLLPGLATDLWSWKLTPLTARMVGAWWIGVAVALAVAGLSASARQVGVAAPAFVAFALLQVANLLRFRDSLTGPGPLWPAALLLVALLALGLWALALGRGR